MKKNKQKGQQLHQTSLVLADSRVIKNPTHAITEPLGSLFC